MRAGEAEEDGVWERGEAVVWVLIKKEACGGMDARSLAVFNGLVRWIDQTFQRERQREFWVKHPVAI